MKQQEINLTNRPKVLGHNRYHLAAATAKFLRARTGPNTRKRHLIDNGIKTDEEAWQLLWIIDDIIEKWELQ